MPARLKVLFVCGKNKRRSPTAERIFKSDRRIEARSAGLAETSKHRINESDIKWADLILVMQRKYLARLKIAFKHLDELPPIESMEITDDYIFMNPELVELLRDGLEEALENYAQEREAAKGETGD